QHLGALLCLRDPPEGVDAAAAALAAVLERDEAVNLRPPPARPATDPAFDNNLLAPAIDRYDAARLRVAAAEDPERADALLAA
ncbi:hypothetical protein ACLQ15_31780, partial [Streptomyces sp. DT18]